MRAFLASHRGDIPGIIQYANQALEQLPPDEMTWQSLIAVALGDAHGMTDDMNAAYKARVSAFEMSKSEGNIYLILLTSMKLAANLRMQGELQQVMDI